MPNPPLGFTGKIQFLNITRGSFVSDGGGGLPHFAGDVSVRIDNDGSGVFSVLSLETLALQSDPDAPRGSRAWQTVATVEGAGPIRMGSQEALMVTVGFTCSLSANQPAFTASASVVASGTAGPALLQIPLSAIVDFVGQLVIDPVASPLLEGISPGETKSLNVLLKSTLQQDVVGMFSSDPGTLSPFSSTSVNAVVPARGNTPITVPVTCANGTAPGIFDNVKFVFASTDVQGNSQALLRIHVFAARSVAVSTDLSPNLTLQPGTSTPGKITVQDSGGNSLIAFQPGSVPNGISLDIGDPHTISGGAFPDASRVVEADITIRIDAGAASQTAPVILNWTVPSDDEHVPVSGFLTFNVTISPGTSMGPFCVFADPPGSPTVGLNAWGLKDGRPRKSQLSWSASGAVNSSVGAPILLATNQQPPTGVIPTAIARWSAAAPALTFTYVGLSGGDISFFPASLSNVPGALGLTDYAGSTVNFSNSVAYVPQVPGNPSLLAIAIHEIGHALGLLHNTNPASVMYPFNANNETLGIEDIGAIRALYGWAPQNPLPDFGTETGPALCACGGLLMLAWRGIGDDHNIWFSVSSDGQSWSAQQTVPGAASSDGTSLAWDGSQVWMAWKGVPGDQGLYFANWEPVNAWGKVTNIGNTGSSCAPSIAIVGNPILVWKGVDGDSGIYFSTFLSAGWAGQQNIGGVGTSDRPAISADPVTGVPRMVWKGVDGDHALYTSTLRNLFWQPQEEVTWLVAGNGPAGTVSVGRPGSELGPALTTAGGRLSMVWRGEGDDQELWYTQAAPDAGVSGQSTTEWSTQANVGGFASSSRPAIAVFAGRTFLAWKGAGDDHRIFITFV